MLYFLECIQTLGWMLYAGPMLAFSILVHTNSEHESINSFQKWGVGFGLALTMCIYSSVVLQYLTEGHLYPNPNQKPWLLPAFIMWISNIKLEIWTLDPLRKSEQKTKEQLKKAQSTFKKHLIVHALLILVTQILFVKGGF